MSLERMRKAAHDDPAGPTTRTVARFEVRYSQYLDEHGRLAKDAPPFGRDLDKLVEL